MATKLPKDQKGFAITSMVCGIAGLVFCLNYPLILINMSATIVGFVFGVISLAKKKGGRGMAIAGVVTAAVTLAIYVLLLFIGTIGVIGGLTINS